MTAGWAPDWAGLGWAGQPPIQHHPPVPHRCQHCQNISRDQLPAVDFSQVKSLLGAESRPERLEILSVSKRIVGAPLESNGSEWSKKSLRFLCSEGRFSEGNLVHIKEIVVGQFSILEPSVSIIVFDLSYISSVVPLRKKKLLFG